jgi:hypothetical protein
MFSMDIVKDWAKRLKKTVTQRRERKLAEMAELESRERQALVSLLTKKFADAHADCEQDDDQRTMVELSLKEVVFIESNLKTWVRHFRDKQIFQPSPQSQSPAPESR